jgi:hypothetical protein
MKKHDIITIGSQFVIRVIRRTFKLNYGASRPVLQFILDGEGVSKRSFDKRPAVRARSKHRFDTPGTARNSHIRSI